MLSISAKIFRAIEAIDKIEKSLEGANLALHLETNSHLSQAKAHLYKAVSLYFNDE